MAAKVTGSANVAPFLSDRQVREIFQVEGKPLQRTIWLCGRDRWNYMELYDRLIGCWLNDTVRYSKWKGPHSLHIYDHMINDWENLGCSNRSSGPSYLARVRRPQRECQITGRSLQQNRTKLHTQSFQNHAWCTHVLYIYIYIDIHTSVYFNICILQHLYTQVYTV